MKTFVVIPEAAPAYHMPGQAPQLSGTQGEE